MRVFVQKGKANPLQWEIWLEGETVHMRSGVVGGKMKHTSDRPGSIGKKGTKAYRDPLVHAVEIAERQIREKVERLGYREVNPDSREFLEDQSDEEINWSDPPKNMRFMKCRKQPNDDEKKKLAELDEVITSGRAIYTVKRDGMMHPIFIDENEQVHIFTRRFDRCTDNYPHLRKEVEQCKFPPRTILLTELVCLGHMKKDNRRLVQTLDRSLPQRAVEIQQDPFRRPKAVVLGIPYYNGAPIMASQTVDNWIDFLYRTLEGVEKRLKKSLTYIEPMMTLHGDFDDIVDQVIASNWEGLVIYDGEAAFGDAVVNFRGREERPRAWKWKIYHEDDFVVLFDPEMLHAEHHNQSDKQVGTWGRGRLQFLPGAVALYQFDSNETPHYICNLGSGFSEDQRKELLETAEANNGIAGVAEVRFESRTYKSEGYDTNALTAPIFVRWTVDKEPEEVINNHLNQKKAIEELYGGPGQ